MEQVRAREQERKAEADHRRANAPPPPPKPEAPARVEMRPSATGLAMAAALKGGVDLKSQLKPVKKVTREPVKPKVPLRKAKVPAKTKQSGPPARKSPPPPPPTTKPGSPPKKTPPVPVTPPAPPVVVTPPAPVPPVVAAPPPVTPSPSPPSSPSSRPPLRAPSAGPTKPLAEYSVCSRKSTTTSEGVDKRLPRDDPFAPWGQTPRNVTCPCMTYDHPEATVGQRMFYFLSSLMRPTYRKRK
ncbi:MAG: hypothetical protein KVP17_000547 [Porospora cf. gigantea B]|nr:MAG: hypothetical protein KVP17_000547 [Porospora cf. gigantea B]